MTATSQPVNGASAGTASAPFETEATLAVPRDLPAYLAPHLAAFDACFRRYLALAPATADNMGLKRDHSLRVLAEALRITASLGPADGLTPELERLIHLAALFHDVGRFPQLVRYGTFNDRVSANHGVLGVKTLRSEGLLDGLPLDDARLVRATVGMHNRLETPRGLPRGLDLALRVVRDADKLDILPVLLAHFGPGAENDVVTLGLSRDPEAYTASLLERLLSRRAGIYEEMRSINDFRLLLLSWTYGLNFPVSRRAMLERGHMKALADGLPDQPPFRGLYDRLRADLMAD